MLHSTWGTSPAASGLQLTRTLGEQHERKYLWFLTTTSRGLPLALKQPVTHLHRRPFMIKIKNTKNTKKKSQRSQTHSMWNFCPGTCSMRVLIVSHLSGVKKAHIESWARRLARTRPLLTQHTRLASPSTMTAFVPPRSPPPSSNLF